MNLLKCIMTHSTCYKGTGKATPVGVLWHDTAGGNPYLKRYVQPYKGDENYEELMEKLGTNYYGNDWNHIDVQAGLNAWIGKLADDSIATVQTLPWDYRPWGCGSGVNGSCNGTNGGKFFVQFEICDDSYKDRDYFNKVYKEACEFTAYICKMFNIDPNGTVNYNGVNVPTILCHKDSNKLGLGSNHADVYTWFNKFGKTMDDVRKDVTALMSEAPAPTHKPNTLYRVRKSWDDKKSQIGAYAVLKNAQDACDKAGSGYYVFDASGEVVYPVMPSTARPTLKNGSNGDIVKNLQTQLTALGYSCGPIDGVFGAQTLNAVKKFQADYKLIVDGVVGEQTWGALSFDTYKVKVTADALNIRSGPGINYTVVGCIKDKGTYTIVYKSGDWGLLKSKAGWIHLGYTKKV